ncbi:hypothetical protein ACIQOF_22085 [Streptomyces sp. NPDC091265]|uniref:hypothetical protein n=1 Tax=unclassified Streptomyces TaxID=2593676 RepID=UPI00344EC525
MRNRIRTASTLLRIGLAAGRATPGDRLRWWGLFGAAAAVAFVVLASVATVATFDGRETRADARGPVVTFGKGVLCCTGWGPTPSAAVPSPWSSSGRSPPMLRCPPV